MVKYFSLPPWLAFKSTAVPYNQLRIYNLHEMSRYEIEIVDDISRGRHQPWLYCIYIYTYIRIIPLLSYPQKWRMHITFKWYTPQVLPRYKVAICHQVPRLLQQEHPHCKGLKFFPSTKQQRGGNRLYLTHILK